MLFYDLGEPTLQTRVWPKVNPYSCPVSVPLITAPGHQTLAALLMKAVTPLWTSSKYTERVAKSNPGGVQLFRFLCIECFIDSFLLLEYFLSYLYLTQTLLVDVSLFDEVGQFIKQAGTWSWENKTKLPRFITVKPKTSHLCQFRKILTFWRFRVFLQRQCFCVYVCVCALNSGFKRVQVCLYLCMHMNACRLLRNDNDVSVWFKKRKDEVNRSSEWNTKKIQDSACHLLLSTVLVVLYLLVSFQVSVLFFWSTQLVLCTCCPYLSSPFSSSDSLSYLLFITTAFSVLVSLPPSLVLLLSQAWHCAMVEEGLCPDASWLRNWDLED